jgi:hypothetical protein
MATQAIIYSKATGRVRRVLDPQDDVADDVLTQRANPGVGEAVHIYTKLHGGRDHLLAWQAAVNSVTGLDPDAAKADWHVVISNDGANTILRHVIADLACGDSYEDGTLVQAPWGVCPGSHLYDGANFTLHPESGPAKRLAKQ